MHHAGARHVLLPGTVVDGLVPGSTDTRRRACVAAEGDEDGDQEERDGGRKIRQGNDPFLFQVTGFVAVKALRADAATLGPASRHSPGGRLCFLSVWSLRF